MSPELTSGGGGGGSSGGGGGGSSGGSWYDVLRPLAALIRKHGVKGAILFVVLEWLVGGIVAFLTNVLQLVLEAFALVAQTPITLATSVIGVLGPVGDGLLMPWRVFTDMLVGLATAAGPFAPIVFALGLWLAAETVIRLYGYVFKVINPA